MPSEHTRGNCRFRVWKGCRKLKACIARDDTRERVKLLCYRPPKARKVKRDIWFLTLSLASLAGCAGMPASPGPVAAVPVGSGIERLPPINAPPPLPVIPPPSTAKKSFWQCLWPWDDERDARPKTQKEIDDDFKWRNNG